LKFFIILISIVKKQIKVRAKASDKMSAYEILDDDESLRTMTIKQYSQHYINKYRKQNIKCMKESEGLIDCVRDKWVDEEGNPNERQKIAIKLHTKYINKFKTELMLYGCLEKKAPENLIKKIAEKLDEIYNDELEYSQELAEHSVIDENKYLEVCDTLKYNREAVMRLIEIQSFIV
jgi:hypothetical protein